MSAPPRARNKLNLLAYERLAQLGLDPMTMLIEAIDYNKQATLSGGGPEYAGHWLRGCCELMKYRYPALSAVAIKDVSDKERKAPMTSQQAIEVLRKDPFLSDPEAPVVDLQSALFPKGKMNEKLD